MKLDIENGNKKIKMNSNIKYIIRRKKDRLIEYAKNSAVNSFPLWATNIANAKFYTTEKCAYTSKNNHRQGKILKVALTVTDIEE